MAGLRRIHGRRSLLLFSCGRMGEYHAEGAVVISGYAADGRSLMQPVVGGSAPGSLQTEAASCYGSDPPAAQQVETMLDHRKDPVLAVLVTCADVTHQSV